MATLFSPKALLVTISLLFVVVLVAVRKSSDNNTALRLRGANKRNLNIFADIPPFRPSLTRVPGGPPNGSLSIGTIPVGGSTMMFDFSNLGGPTAPGQNLGGGVTPQPFPTTNFGISGFVLDTPLVSAGMNTLGGISPDGGFGVQDYVNFVNGGTPLPGTIRPPTTTSLGDIALANVPAVPVVTVGPSSSSGTAMGTSNVVGAPTISAQGTTEESTGEQSTPETTSP